MRKEISLYWADGHSGIDFVLESLPLRYLCTIHVGLTGKDNIDQQEMTFDQQNTDLYKYANVQMALGSLAHSMLNRIESA